MKQLPSWQRLPLPSASRPSAMLCPTCPIPLPHRSHLQNIHHITSLPSIHHHLLAIIWINGLGGDRYSRRVCRSCTCGPVTPKSQTSSTLSSSLPLLRICPLLHRTLLVPQNYFHCHPNPSLHSPSTEHNGLRTRQKGTNCVMMFGAQPFAL